ncbi:MAG: hypothetical protein Q9205_005280 [Flavoplaca limonia]
MNNGAAVVDAGSDGAQISDLADFPETEAANVQQGTPLTPESVPTAERPFVEEAIPAIVPEHHHKPNNIHLASHRSLHFATSTAVKNNDPSSAGAQPESSTDQSTSSSPDKPSNSNTTSPSITAAIAFSVIVIILFSAIIAIVLLWRQRRRQPPTQEQTATKTTQFRTRRPRDLKSTSTSSDSLRGTEDGIARPAEGKGRQWVQEITIRFNRVGPPSLDGHFLQALVGLF